MSVTSRSTATRIVAAFACAFTALAATACSSSEESASNFTSVPSSSEAAATSEATTTEAEIIERSAEDFKRAELGAVWYELAFGDGARECLIKPDQNFLSCEVQFNGVIPPMEMNDTSGVFADDDPDTIDYEEGLGFKAVYDVTSHPIDTDRVLNAGETVVIDGATFTLAKDGTARVERDDHWFEVDTEGQYSSDRFDPDNPPAPTSAESKPEPSEAPAPQQQTVSDAEKYADLIAPGDTFCTTFPYNGGVYVVSSSSGNCTGVDLLQEFVSTPITTPGHTDLYYDRGGVLWHCGYAGSGAGYCEPQAGGGGVIGRGTAAR